jgi:hypothetical protein
MYLQERLKEISIVQISYLININIENCYLKAPA